MARARRTRAPRGPRRLTWAAVGFVLGLLLMFGVGIHIVLGFAGFALMFAAVVVAVPELQRRRDEQVDRQQQT